MLLKTLIALCFLTAASLAAEEHVVVLTDSNFESILAKHNVVLVMFYSPDCAHCKAMKPDFEEAAETLILEETSIVLAKINCPKDGVKTCEAHEVGQYPTLKIFRNGKDSQLYQGSRDAGGIVHYMKVMGEPSPKPLKSLKAFQDFLKSSNNVTIVGFFETTSTMSETYMQFVSLIRDMVRCGYSSAKGVLENQKQKDTFVLYRPIYLHNKFEENSIVYRGKPNTKDMIKFINENQFGLVGHRLPSNAIDFGNPKIVAFFEIDYRRNVKMTNYYRNRILKVASKFVGRIKFSMSNMFDFIKEIDDYGLIADPADKVIVLATSGDKKKYPMKENFSVEALTEFTKDFLAGNLKPYMKSSDIPEPNDKAMKEVVALTFYDMVMKNDQDVLIEFYEPWCEECKKLSVLLEKAAQILVHENVTIVKMDATTNDIPLPFDPKVFPTINWVPKNSKHAPKFYDGGKESEDDVVKFIAKHATEELHEFDRNGVRRLEKVEL